MSTFKKTKVDMLPTNEKAPNHDYLFLYKPSNRLVKNGFVQHLYFLSDEEIKEGDWCLDVIAKQVFQVDSKILNSIKSFEKERFKKIIATTDKSLSEQIMYYPNGAIIGGIESYKLLPQPSQSFIEKFVEEYNKGNVITEVLVEYDFIKGIGAEFGYKSSDIEVLKISKDNTITIRKIKDSWNRDEVRELLITAYSKGRTNILLREFNEWLKENL